MRRLRRLQLALLFFLLAAALVFTSGFSYLDPGAGSLLVQILIAAALTAAAALRRFRSRLISFFKRERGRRG